MKNRVYRDTKMDPKLRFTRPRGSSQQPPREETEEFYTMVNTLGTVARQLRYVFTPVPPRSAFVQQLHEELRRRSEDRLMRRRRWWVRWALGGTVVASLLSVLGVVVLVLRLREGKMRPTAS